MPARSPETYGPDYWEMFEQLYEEIQIYNEQEECVNESAA